MLDPRRVIVFWTGVMRDHAIFQINAFTSKEAYYVQNSMQYMNFFQQQLNRIENGEALEVIYPVLLNGVTSFIEYKKLLLKGLMTCQLQMNLPPSLINHMINEAMEFQSLLAMPVKNKIVSPLEMANRLKIWLTDSVGHAAGLAAFLDLSETLLLEENMKFKKSFEKLLMKASELEMMLSKTFLNDGILEYLGEETVELMEMYICFLEKIKKLRASCKVLGMGTLAPLLPDHLIREHRYYIENIKASK